MELLTFFGSLLAFNRGEFKSFLIFEPEKLGRFGNQK